MKRLLTIDKTRVIPAKYRNTPIAHLVEYQNLGRRFRKYTKATLLIGMCMDNRKALRIPANFAFVLRTGGANLRNNEFKIAYAVALGNVRHIALIGHNHCGMVNLEAKRKNFIKGLMKNAGWKKTAAENFFNRHVSTFEIRDEADFILNEVNRLRFRYPKVIIAPMLYKIEDSQLYFLKEK